MGVLQPDLFKRWNLGGTGGEGVLSSEFYVGGGASTEFSKKQLIEHFSNFSCYLELLPCGESVPRVLKTFKNNMAIDSLSIRGLQTYTTLKLAI